jgi:hypothetical protein
MIVTRYLLVWTDNHGVGHAREFEGNRAEAYSALKLIAKKYADGEGFLHARALPITTRAQTLGDVQLEVDGEIY